MSKSQDGFYRNEGTGAVSCRGRSYLFILCFLSMHAVIWISKCSLELQIQECNHSVREHRVFCVKGLLLICWCCNSQTCLCILSLLDADYNLFAKQTGLINHCFAHSFVHCKKCLLPGGKYLLGKNQDLPRRGVYEKRRAELGWVFSVPVSLALNCTEMSEMKQNQLEEE